MKEGFCKSKTFLQDDDDLQSMRPDESQNRVIVPVPSTPSNIDDLYEQTINALCSWLPRVFTSISPEMCKMQGKRAAK